MKSITINDSKKISDLQKEFNDVFPFLKLEFFHRPHVNHRGSVRKDMFNTGMTLKECNKKDAKGSILLKADMKVSELEELFQNVFGLSVQVFRKSGNAWLETTVTDDWSLEQQNDAGRELSSLSE